MENYVDPDSMASNSGSVRLSKQKFTELRDNVLKIGMVKKLYYNKQFRRIDQYLQNGDTQPAIVVSESPFIVSAYSDEMDAVIFLKFPDELAIRYNLKKGSRLVTSNIYFLGSKISSDIQTGSNYLNQYVEFTPVVQLFLCDDENYIINRTGIFNEEMWNRVIMLTEERENKNIAPRDGFYYFTKFNLLFMIF